MVYYYIASLKADVYTARPPAAATTTTKKMVLAFDTSSTKSLLLINELEEMESAIYRLLLGAVQI